MQELSTVSEVFAALGGNRAVSELTGRNPKAVSMWKTLGAMPWHTQLVITEALRKRRKRAAPCLWGLKTKGRNAA